MASISLQSARSQPAPFASASQANAESSEQAHGHGDDAFAYAGAPNRITSAYAAVRQSSIGRYINRPGILKPLASGLGAAVSVNAIPAVVTTALNGGLALFGADTCALGTHLWSKWGQNAGVAGAVLGLVLGGEVARESHDIAERQSATAMTAAALTVLGQSAQLIQRAVNYEGKSTGQEFICLMPEIPVYNVLIAAPLALLAGYAIAQAGAFVHSAAHPDDEESRAGF